MTVALCQCPQMAVIYSFGMSSVDERTQRRSDRFRRSLDRASGFFLLVLLLCLWETSARLHWVESPNWPPISHIISALGRSLWAGELLEASISTLYVTFVGFSVGVILAVIVGILMASVRSVDYLLEPVVELCRPIPISSIVPPLILLLGIDNKLKIFVVAFATFFPVLVNTVYGVKAVSPTILEVARTFQRRRSAILLRVVLPASLPYISAGMRVALALALIVTIVAEMIAGSSGIGYYLLVTQYAMRAEEMYAAILFLAIIGYALNALFVWFERRLLPWFHIEAS